MTEQDLYELIGRKDAQIFMLNKQVVKLHNEVVELKKPPEKKKSKKP